MKVGLNVSNQYLPDESMAQRIDKVIEQVDVMLDQIRLIGETVLPRLHSLT